MGPKREEKSSLGILSTPPSAFGSRLKLLAFRETQRAVGAGIPHYRWDGWVMGTEHPDIQCQGGNGEFLAPRPVVRPWGLCSALFPSVLSPLLPQPAPAAGANNRNVPPRKSKSPNSFNELLLQALSFTPPLNINNV